MQIIRPKLTPRQVWRKYGFPLVSKEIADYIHDVETNPTTKTAQKRIGKGDWGVIPHKWRFLINEPFSCNDACCNKLKKSPVKKFEKKFGRHPITGEMASESLLRTAKYITNGGCNSFGEHPRSTPLAIWTEEDIWEYIRRFNVPIADIYYKGALRTGCMGCGFGAQYADDNRFQLLLQHYPKCYDMVMNYTNNGITFREAIRKVLAVNGRYLPDEEPPTSSQVSSQTPLLSNAIIT